MFSEPTQRPGGYSRRAGKGGERKGFVARRSRGSLGSDGRPRRPLEVRRPFGVFRPVVGEPTQRCFRAGDLDVSTGPQSRDFFRIAEDAPTDLRVGMAAGSSVGVYDQKKGSDHAHIGKKTDSGSIVNGNHTGCKKARIRSNYRAMELSEILARVERRLTALGVSADAASTAAKKPDAIRNLRRAVEQGSRKGISTTTIEALARALHTKPEWLLFEIGDEDGWISESGPASLRAITRNSSKGILRSQGPGETLAPQIVQEGVRAIAVAIEAALEKRMKRRPTDAEMEYLAELSRELFGARRVLAQFDHQEESQTRRATLDHIDDKAAVHE